MSPWLTKLLFAGAALAAGPARFEAPDSQLNLSLEGDSLVFSLASGPTCRVNGAAGKSGTLAYSYSVNGCQVHFGVGAGVVKVEASGCSSCEGFPRLFQLAHSSCEPGAIAKRKKAVERAYAAGGFEKSFTLAEQLLEDCRIFLGVFDRVSLTHSQAKAKWRLGEIPACRELARKIEYWSPLANKPAEEKLFREISVTVKRCKITPTPIK